ncbi:cell division protein FtsA [Thiosulfatimonas sediminis]|uniref:Cell division protein FtsA n=1 Tax=Thiosulfatimonas sediminis TaxID=2675054 RepID=A0A6F8PWM8_9GAMM|nr:cell division protein FtsA [Thiosulfatimonas sediminis]BBP46525.1 cell division protein FtsA [Thiosulfatimonas sediminis]
MASNQSGTKTIVGLDIGTSKIKAVVGEITGNVINVRGYKSVRTKGLRNGVVIHIEGTKKSIETALHEALEVAGYRVDIVDTAYIGITGGHIKSINSHGVITIDDEVTDEDIRRVNEQAHTGKYSESEERMLHVLPKEFTLDMQEGIVEPVGMVGKRLEVKTHIITASESAVRNIEKCVQSAGLKNATPVLAQYAASEAVLSDDEKALGVCVVDIGGGTTDITVYRNGSMQYTSVLPIAGNYVTNDIAIAFNTPTDSAEEIKVRYGCAMPSLIKENFEFDVQRVGEREPFKLNQRLLSEVIRPRMEEIFESVEQRLRRDGFSKEMFGAGIVITGGSSMMFGSNPLAEEIFDMPVRIGSPKNDMFVGGILNEVSNAEYSSALGLLQYASQNFDYHNPNHIYPVAVSDSPGFLDSIFDSMRSLKEWFKKSF